MDPRIRKIAQRHGIDAPYPEAVLDEASRWERSPDHDDPRLVDRTDLPFVTIDNEDSRDLDQAVYVESTPTGWTVWYALADASYYVRPGTALFEEGLRRGASYYLPRIAFPMLPRTLSEGVVSLNEGVLRRAVVFRLDVRHDGTSTQSRVERSRIRSRAKLSYKGVQELYDGDPTLVGEPFEESLRAMARVGEARIAAARARHVVRFQRGESRLRTEQYNEQISLLCNVEGARLLARGADDPAVQAVFRAHPSPPAERLAAFARLTKEAAGNHDLDPDTWTWDQQTPLADYLAALPDDHRAARAIHHHAVMVNVRSVFQDLPEAHFGIGAEFYARFSAPMREIVGIFTHEEALEYLGYAPPSLDDALRMQVIEAGNRSKALQKQLDKAAALIELDDLFLGDLERPEDERPWRVGTVMGSTGSRFYVRLDDPSVEVKVYREPRDLRLGDEVRLRTRKRRRRPDRWEFVIR